MAQNQLKEELILSTQHFDAQIQSVMKKVDALDKKGKNIGGGFNSSMGNMSKKANAFNGSINALSGSFAKLGGAISAVAIGAKLGDWIGDTISKASQLAEEAEGVRLAFQRLNQPDMLSNLREATHNTVTDVELMKAAVKFNDFNLPTQELGTFLAFAQQKAKDTGESIDYMVNSIVTGLGRKSLPILDNLGISATEIKERMKEGGDMTTAVAAIIQERMKEAGDYVETAADRAKAKEVEVENALVSLGNEFQPVKETAVDFWHTCEMWGIKVLKVITNVIAQATTLGQTMEHYNNLGGDKRIEDWTGRLLNSNGKVRKDAKKTYEAQKKNIENSIAYYKRYSDAWDKWQKGDRSNGTKALIDESRDKLGDGAAKEVKARMRAREKVLEEYVRRGQQILSKADTKAPKVDIDDDKKKTKTSKTEVNYEIGSIGYLEKKIQKLNEKLKLQVTVEGAKEVQDEIKKTQIELNNLVDPKREIKIEMKQMDIALTPIKVPVEPIIKDLSTKYKEIQEKIQDNLEKLDMGIIGKQQAEEYINALNGQLIKMGLKPIKVEILSDTQQLWQDIETNAGSIMQGFEGIDNIASSVNTLAESLSNGANAWEIFMGALQTGMSIIEGVNGVLNTINTLQILFGETSIATASQVVAASSAEASAAQGVALAKANESIATATAEGAKLGWPMMLIAIATGIATVLGALGMMGSYANGGIIGGNSYSGDRLFARVNSGEAILNTNQQKHLFELLDGNHSGGGINGNVHFVIKGKDLVGTLNNYDDKMKKVR